ncbi:5-hydroxytryptamine receptor 3A-like, partial [Pseudonaja textilis]|uniref:5-hydroxytryptamine receptor 3A-like n=1 Tax=Pseudonaja textilis TaxID=8673 RepID=UPI000EA91B8B
WKNEFVSWDPLDFCNITDISLPVNLFWTPHIFIDEQADEDKHTVSHFIYLSFDGYIVLFQAHQLTSACNLDVHTFPFDEQKCNITMVPSLYRENEVKLKNTKTFKNTNQDSRKRYLADGEWKFQKVEIMEVTEIEADGKYSTVIYQISMKRRSILYELMVILPMFILFLLDMAISYAFASPAEKIAYKVTMILQVSFLSVMLIDKLPPTSDYPPVIAMFFIGIFAFMVLGILENACMEYCREQNFKLPSFKNFTRKFLRKEKIKAEDSISDVGEEIDMENKQTREFPLVENDNADSLVFLKQVTLELQQIKKHLALEEGKEVSGPALQDKYVRLEKCLCYTRLILSLGFIAFIVVQWTS